MPPVFCVTGPYGQVVYGQPWALPVGSGFEEVDPRRFSGSLRADAYDHGTIALSWTIPTGAVIDRFAVVRAAYGTSTTRYGGVTIIEGDPGSPVRSTLDSVVEPGRWYYYALFVRETVSERWVRAATASQIAVKDWAYHTDLWRGLPTFYRTLDRSLAPSVAQGPLYRFLKIFAFEFDWLRTLAGNVEQARSVENVHAKLLEMLALDLGTPYETVLGERKMRGILAALIGWRKEKGTKATLDDLLRTISGCADAHAELGPNLLLDHNSSGSDEPTLGHWFTTQGTIVRSTNPDPGPRSSGAYLEYDTAVGDSAFTSAPLNDVLRYGMKVEPGQIYCASIYTQAATAARVRTVAVDILWYDRHGVLAAGTAPENTEVWGPYGEVVYGQTHWKGPRGPVPYGSGIDASPEAIGDSMTLINNDTDWETRVWRTEGAPADARFAVMQVTVEDGTNVDIHYFDEAMFEQASQPSDFEAARKVFAYICGGRTNVVLNPTFEENALGWTTINTALTLSTAHFRFGSQSLLMQPLAPGVVTASTVVNVNPAKFYTFSGYMKPVDNDTDITVAVEWTDVEGNVLRTHGRDDTLVNDGNFKRPSLTDVGPEGSVRAVVSFIAYLGTGEQMALDAVLVEAGDALQDYFDGSFAGVDFSWAGAAHESESIHIPNREVYESVLGRYLDEYVPATQPWEIVYTA